MKLCLISPQYPGYGGYGVYLSYLVRGLGERGYEVHTLTGPPPASLPQTHNRNFHILPTGSYEGFRFVNFELRINRKLSKLQRQERFDLIQYNLPTYFGLPLFHPPSLPLLITAHGCIAEMIRDFLHYKPSGLDLADLVYIGGGPFIPRMERWAFSQADRIVAVCDWVRRALIRLYDMPSERVATIHNGVDTTRFKPVKHARRWIADLLGSQNSERPLVLYMARIMGAKDPATLAHAIPRILESHPDALFLFRGEGVTLQTYMKSLLTQAAPRDSYKFLEFVRSDDMAALYSAASVYVLPSIHEPLAYTLLEALACGAPTVASAVGGIPEIISHKKNGLLVEPGNSVMLANAIAMLLEDQRMAQRLGRAARETIKANFNLPLFVERFDREILRLAG